MRIYVRNPAINKRGHEQGAGIVIHIPRLHRTLPSLKRRIRPRSAGIQRSRASVGLTSFPRSGVEVALRLRAELDEPRSKIAYADTIAWAKAEGEGSALELEAIGRKDVERVIPGLPARRTFMAIGWVTMGAVALNIGLSWMPQSSLVDVVSAIMSEGVADVAIAAAAWSLLSEVRGWDGSDASTWFLLRRVRAFDKALAIRRHRVCETLVAVRADKIAVYSDEAGSITAQTFTPQTVSEVVLEHHNAHESLHLVTSEGAFSFDWLRRDAAFDAEVKLFAALVEADLKSSSAARDGFP